MNVNGNKAVGAENAVDRNLGEGAFTNLNPANQVKSATSFDFQKVVAHGTQLAEAARARSSDQPRYDQKDKDGKFLSWKEIDQQTSPDAHTLANRELANGLYGRTDDSLVAFKLEPVSKNAQAMLEANEKIK